MEHVRSTHRVAARLFRCFPDLADSQPKQFNGITLS